MKVIWGKYMIWYDTYEEKSLRKAIMRRNELDGILKIGPLK